MVSSLSEWSLCASIESSGSGGQLAVSAGRGAGAGRCGFTGVADAVSAMSPGAGVGPSRSSTERLGGLRPYTLAPPALPVGLRCWRSDVDSNDVDSPRAAAAPADAAAGPSAGATAGANAGSRKSGS